MAQPLARAAVRVVADAAPTADLTIVIPTLNERSGIDTLHERLFAACDRSQVLVDVIVVDDNSADGTGLAAEQWSSRRPVHVIHRTGKLGLGSAVMEGFAIARTDIVGVMDGDLSHPPEILPRLLLEMVLGNVDLVIASRYVRGGDTRGFTLGRLLLSRAACALARPLTPIRDAMSGYFLIRRSGLLGFRTAVTGFKIGLELFVRSRPRRVVELGYVFQGRTAGRSKMSISEATGFVRQLIRLYVEVGANGVRRPRVWTALTARSR